MTAILYSLAVGFIIGLALAILGVPIPAPSSIAGVTAILGLTLGYLVLRGGL